MTQGDPDWSRVGDLPNDHVDTPSPARVWNYWLGGEDHYDPDQEVGDVVAGIYPGIRTMAVQSRGFLVPPSGIRPRRPGSGSSSISGPACPN